MSNAISGKESDNTNTGTNDLGEEDPIEPTTNETNPESNNTPEDNSRNIKEPVKEETKDTEEVIVPEVVKEETESTLVPVVADSDIAQTKEKKKSTLSKVGKSLASIIASI